MKTSPDDSLAGRTKQLHGVTFTSPVILFLLNEQRSFMLERKRDSNCSGSSEPFTE